MMGSGPTGAEGGVATPGAPGMQCSNHYLANMIVSGPRGCTHITHTHTHTYTHTHTHTGVAPASAPAGVASSKENPVGDEQVCVCVCACVRGGGGLCVCVLRVPRKPFGDEEGGRGAVWGKEGD